MIIYTWSIATLPIIAVELLPSISAPFVHKSAFLCQMLNELCTCIVECYWSGSWPADAIVDTEMSSPLWLLLDQPLNLRAVEQDAFAKLFRRLAIANGTKVENLYHKVRLVWHGTGGRWRLPLRKSGYPSAQQQHTCARQISPARRHRDLSRDPGCSRQSVCPTS